MRRPSRLFLPAALAATAPALAQEGGDPPPLASEPATVTGATTYTPADFIRFAPKTALDMLRQVPGFTIQQPDPNDLRRGLGQAQTNVLINGQRFSGKSNDVVTEVGRIAADNVVRIEIIDGATLDVPGLSGQVANIVTAARGVSGSFAWRPQLRPHTEQSRFTNGEASLSGAALGLDYTVSIANPSYIGGEIGPELVFTPAGTIIDRREEVLWFEGELPRLSVTLKRERGATVANLNAAIGIEHTNVGEISLREGPGQVDRDRRLDEKRRNWDYEIGGDYEFSLGAGRLKLIGLRRFDHQPFTQLLTIDFADGAPRTGDRFEQVADQAETILRSEYRWKAGVADWQLSAEGALNVLDIDNSLARIDPGSGVFVPVPLPGSSARVDEQRAEVALSYGRPLSATLSFQGSVGGEYSKLSQSSDNGLTRIFYRPKGFVSLAWKPSPGLDVSAKLERVVGQLNFFDFVASSNVSAGTTNSSNPNLVPPQSWDAEIEATRSLGAFGTATARVYGRLITDIVDFIPIDDGQAPGNLDSARLYGVQWTSTFNFDPLGWRGAKLDLDLQFQKTELEDPVTGRIRGINETMYRRILANLRHDVPGTPWAYGMGYDEYRDTAGFRLDQKIEFVTELGDLSAFIEHKDVLGLTVRGTIGNLLGSNVQLTRDFYEGRRTGPLLFTEDRNRGYGPVFTLAISGKI
jgi:outer membrane receptor for ferrienterochelin and colicins